MDSRRITRPVLVVRARVMQTVLLAADRRAGASVLSTVASTPMLPVVDRPLAAHAADAAVEAGATELVFAVAENAPRVQSHFGGRYRGVPVSYSVCERRGRPAAALHAVRDRIVGSAAVLDATRYVDRGTVAELFDRPDPVAVHEPRTGDSVRQTVGDGGVRSGHALHDAPVAACRLPAQALGGVPDGTESLADVVAACGVDHDVVDGERTVAVDGATALVAATAAALSADRPSDATPRPDSSTSPTQRVADDARVDTDVTLDGPVAVAPGATIGDGAVVRGPVVVGPDASVGTGARVESAVLFEDAAVEAGAAVAGGVFGPGCAVRDGARIGAVAGVDEERAAAFVADGGRDGLRYW